MKRKPKENFSVFVEVHQNGELLSKTSRAFNRRGSIYLTSDPDGELTAPYYALPNDIRILQITRRGIEVDLDPNWEGFTTFEGKIEDISSDRKSAYTHLMKKGDYGSIAYNDLRILIRIGKNRLVLEQKKSTHPQYRGSFFELWMGNKQELKYLAVGFLSASWFIGGFALGLYKHPDDRPREFIDLRNEYTLPFIHPLHLINAPESLQSNYDRSSSIRSALEFARGFTDTLLGYDNLTSQAKDDQIIFLQTKRRYEQLYQNQSDEIQAFGNGRTQRESQILSDDRNGLIAMPTILGESISGSLLRLEDKLRIWHEGASFTLKQRRLTSREFAADNSYDFTEYRNTKGGSKGAAKVQNNTASADEDAMYKEVEKLASFAEENQERIVRFREPIVQITNLNSSPLGILVDNNFMQNIQKIGFKDFNTKLDAIQASKFNPDQPKVIREPLIGTLDPQLIEQTVTRYRFELQLCYELALRRNQQAEGSMEWQWLLDTQGKVLDIDLLKSSIADTKMVECVRGKIANWKWPRPQKGSIQISYPFQFKPAKG